MSCAQMDWATTMTDDGDYDIVGMASSDHDDVNRSNKRAKQAGMGGGNALTKDALKKARRNKATAEAA